MEKNNFKMDTQISCKKNFLEKNKGIYNWTLLFSGICALSGALFIVRGIAERVWNDVGTVVFARQLLGYCSMICIFVSLIKILVDAKPFSKTLTWCMRIIAIMFMAGSIIIPRLDGYESSGFELFSNGDFALIDVGILLPGLLLYVFSMLLYEGFAMQKEMDEIL